MRYSIFPTQGLNVRAKFQLSKLKTVTATGHTDLYTDIQRTKILAKPGRNQKKFPGSVLASILHMFVKQYSLGNSAGL